MSGIEVIGAISAVIGIIDACVKTYDSASKDLKLSETFRAVARQLPILAGTLATCKAHLEPRKSSITPDVCKALEETLRSCDERARNLRTIFEKVITAETDGWTERYVKAVRKLGKGNRVEELMKALTEDVQLVVNHRTVQSAEAEQRQQLEQILEEVQKLEPSMGDEERVGTNITNWSGTQNVNTGDGQQFNYENMSGTQHFNLVMRQKLDSRFTQPVGLCLNQAPEIDSSLFVGRATEISQMHQALRVDGAEEQRRLVLGGMGGIGKTQLAIAYAKSKRADYDSIFWINATSETTLKASFQSMAEQIFDVQDLHGLKSGQVIALMKQWLLDERNTKWLLIFDGYDEPKSYDLSAYYPQTSHGAIIITTRLPDEVSTEALTLRPINDIEECLEILEMRSKRENVKQDAHARRLAERLEGLPLALAIAGAFLHKDKNMWTFEQYLNEYEKRWNIDPRGRLQLYEYPNRTLYTTWDLSYRRLEQEDAEVAQFLKLLAYFDHQAMWYELFHAGVQDGLPEWLKTIAGESTDFESVMRILVDYCFLEVRTAIQSYSMHACIHDWTLASLNTTVDPWRYWYAFDCIANSINEEELDYLGYIRYARLAAHAVQLTHDRFREAGQEIAESRLNSGKNVARLLKEQKQFTPATTMYLRVLSGYKEALGSDHTSTLRIVHNIGLLYCDQGKLDKAEEMYLQSWTGIKKVLGPDHTFTLNVINNLGLLYVDQDKLDKAEEMYVQALAGMEKALGSDHTSTLLIVNNLGILYRDQMKLDKAEELYIRARDGMEKALGPDHTSTLETVNNLGLLYADQGKLAEAEKMYARAQTGFKKVRGSDHTSTLFTFHNLGMLYCNQGKLDKAEEMYTRAWTGMEKTLGPGHTSTLQTVYNLGILYHQQGKLDKAEEMYVRAWTGIKQVLGPDHTSTLRIVHNLGFLYTDQGKLAEAEEMYVRVLAGFEKALGKDHVETLQVSTNLGSLCALQGQTEDTKRHFSHALTVYPRIVGSSNATPQAAVHGYAEVLSKSIRTEGSDSSSMRIHLSNLVSHSEQRGSGDIVVTQWLAKALLKFGDDENAQLAFVHSVSKHSEVLDMGCTCCAGCYHRLTAYMGLHVCRQCLDINLCDNCMSAYAKSALTVPTCSDHKFCSFSQAVQQAFKLATPHDKSSRESWIQELEKKYQLIADGK